MAATNINRVILTGNLTRDPELRSLPSGTAVCSLRVACQHPPQGQQQRRVDRQGQLFRCDRLGRAGRELRPLPLQGPAGRVDGRLEWREWEAKDGSGKRQSVEIIADSVQFLGSREEGAGRRQRLLAPQRRPRRPERPPARRGAGRRGRRGRRAAGEDDIPF